MALARQCDRCKRYYSHYTKIMDSSYNINGLYLSYFHLNNKDYNLQKDIDLCPNCMDLLMKFLNVNAVDFSDMYGSISDRDQNIFLMYSIDGLSQSDIAKKVNLSQSQVSIIINRVTHAIKKGKLNDSTIKNENNQIENEKNIDTIKEE